MRVLLAGATGTLGTVVGDTLRDRGHEVVTVSRSAGDLRGDVTDPAYVGRILDEAGEIDAVVSAAGSVPYKTITDMTPADYLSAYRGKVASQIELVRQGTTRIAPRGSFTLITGVLGREPIVTGSAAAMADGAVEAFVLAAALEIAPQRINAVSPTVLTESVPHYGHVFPGGRRDRRPGVRAVDGGGRDGPDLPPPGLSPGTPVGPGSGDCGTTRNCSADSSARPAKPPRPRCLARPNSMA